MLDMRLFIDESGSITTNRNPLNRYFVIGFLETNSPTNVIRHFRSSKKAYIDRTPQSNLNIKEEIKGSKMPFGMKKMIFERLRDKTDVIFHFILVDNYKLHEYLVFEPSLSFNYFIYITIEKMLTLKQRLPRSLSLNIDDRNTALESLNSLEDYLKIKFKIENQVIHDIGVTYHESDKKELIQVIDLFCNTVFRLSKSPESDVKNRTLLSICRIGCKSYFPSNYDHQDSFT